MGRTVILSGEVNTACDPDRGGGKGKRGCFAAEAGGGSRCCGAEGNQCRKRRERVDALAQDLSMTRSENYAYEAQARKAGDEAAEIRQAVANGVPSPRKSAQDEGDRAEWLEKDLATARRDLETQAASEEVAPDEADGGARLSLVAQLAAAGARTFSRTARTGSRGCATRCAQRRDGRLDRAGQVVEESATPIADREPAAGARGDAQPNSEEAAVAAGLVARASALFRQGDIGAARIVLERAVEMGSAQAGFLLAETYDPLILANGNSWDARDAIKAQDLYAKADAGGIQEAKAQFEALRRWHQYSWTGEIANTVLARKWSWWMNGFVGLRRRLLLSALAPLLLIIPPSAADAERRERPQMPQVTVNAWTVGIAGGLLEGAPIRVAAEKVSFDTQGIAAAYSGPLIFSRFGLEVEKTFIPHQVALEQMRKGEMAAVVFITSKPLEAFVRGRWEPGFKFLPVPNKSKFEDYYLPRRSRRDRLSQSDQTGRARRPRLPCRPRW